jgi:hypothetical protein
MDIPILHTRNFIGFIGTGAAYLAKRTTFLANLNAGEFPDLLRAGDAAAGGYAALLPCAGGSLEGRRSDRNSFTSTVRMTNGRHIMTALISQPSCPANSIL